MGPNRHTRIREHLFAHGETPVQELARAIGASLATVRRDLTEMEASGQVERLHGAARIASSARQEAAFAHRETTQLAAKRAIANLAFESIVPGSLIFLDAGTTVLQLARRLLLTRTPLRVATNGLVVARELAQAPQIEVIVLGGRLRAENMSTIGPGAMMMLESLWFDHLFLGASAISDDGLLSSFDAEEAALNRQMARQASAVTVLADQTKFGTRAAFSVMSLEAGQRLITDVPPPKKLADVASRSGVGIMVAGDG